MRGMALGGFTLCQIDNEKRTTSMDDPMREIDEAQWDLWELRSWRRENSDIGGWMSGLTFFIYATVKDDEWREMTAQEAATVVRAMSKGQPIGTVRKTTSTDAMAYSLKFHYGRASVYFTIPRQTVCVSKVVGTKTVERTDPNAPMVTVTEDVLEWECLPLLQEAEGSSI